MNRPDSHALFKSTYTAKKGTQRIQQAIRAEIAGGQDLLDLLELVNVVRTRGEIDKPLEFLTLIEDKLQNIKHSMADEVKSRYQLHPDS